MSFGLSILEILFLIQIALVFGIIFDQRRNPTSTVSWILVLLLLPGLGFFLYLFFGQDWTKRRLFSLKAEDDQRIEDIVIAQRSGLGRFAKDTTYERFLSTIRMLLESNRAFLTADNTLTLFTDGTAKFASLFDAIRAARHHIHLEYYIIRDDTLSRELIQLLTEKAREGVQVRLLADALGMKVKKKGLKEFEQAGGQHAVFFPRIFTLNYRNHRKLAVIDGTTGYIGGYNVGVEYLGKGPLGYWRDAAIRIEGMGVNGLQLRFFMDWNYASSEKLAYDPVYFPKNPGTGKCPVQTVSSGPDARWSQIKEGYVKLILSAEESVYLQTPYFIPDEAITDALRIAALSGVDVRIMIPCKPDHPFVYWSTLSFIGDLLDSGVRAYTYDNGFIHAKTIVADGIAAAVGSANFDIRSFRLNFEASSFFYDQEYGGQLKQAFLDDLPKCTEITVESYRNRSRWIKARESISRLFSPLG
ncbi:MAG: cardiolipin synthase [Methanomicrobiales archaeon]|nr:cardiolipin synthase [Methanomicrobiales archaeon]NYT21454.1 cardiolipin synthase [Methanomicrobiales archaeon]